ARPERHPVDGQARRPFRGDRQRCHARGSREEPRPEGAEVGGSRGEDAKTEGGGQRVRILSPLHSALRPPPCPIPPTSEPSPRARLISAWSRTARASGPIGYRPTPG